MNEINQLTSVLESGEIPAGYDEKAIKKLIKRYMKLDEHRVVRLYQLRCVTYNDTAYCMYACPLNGQEIDPATLDSIVKACEIVEVGNIRYNSVMSQYEDYFDMDLSTWKQKPDLVGRNAITDISDIFEGIVLFSRQESRNKTKVLDCQYAIVGLRNEPGKFSVEPVPNYVIGLEPSGQRYESFGDGMEVLDENSEGAPGFEKYKSAMKILSVIITAAVLIWYFLLK